MMTIENHTYAHYFFCFFFTSSRFYYISAGLMRKTSHGDVSMMQAYEENFNFNKHLNLRTFSYMFNRKIELGGALSKGAKKTWKVRVH